MPFLLALLPNIGSFFLKYWRIILPLLAILGAAWYVHHLYSEAEKYKKLYNQDIIIIQQWSEKFETLDSQYKAAIIACKNTIDDQNKKVEEFAQKAEALKKKATVAQQQSEVLRKQYEDKIKDILNQPKPTSCPDSIQYLIDHAKELKTWEEGPNHE